MYIKLYYMHFCWFSVGQNPFENFACAAQWHPYINVPNCTTKAISTEFYYDRRITFYICQRQKVIKRLNFDLKPILIMSLKILMGQIDDEKHKKLHINYNTCNVFLNLNLIFWKHDSSSHPVSRCLLSLEGAVYLDETGNSIVTLQFTDQAILIWPAHKLDNNSMITGHWLFHTWSYYMKFHTWSYYSFSLRLDLSASWGLPAAGDNPGVSTGPCGSV